MTDSPLTGARAVPSRLIRRKIPRFIMRFNGTLTKWKDEKGFGFITPSGAGDEIFVHASEFPKTRRPKIGDKLIFQVKTSADGRKKAVLIEYFVRNQEKSKTPGHRSSGRASRRSKSYSRGWGGLGSGVMALLACVAFGWYAYHEFLVRPPVVEMSLGNSLTSRSAAGFRCDGRQYCSQMTSCAEATFFNKNCPGVKMDGNHDGIPCETQWCK